MTMKKDARGRDVPTVKYNAVDDKTEIKSKWWMAPEKEMHRHIFGVVNKIKEYQSYRSLQNLRHARLYANMDLVGLQAGVFSRIQNSAAFASNLISYNVVKSCIDTAASKIAKAKPRPMFLTDDGAWELQQKAQDLTRFFEGLFDAMGTGQGDNRTFYGIGRRGFSDSGIFGTGVTKLSKDTANATVKAERILVEEIIVDDTEGMYEQPRQLHQEKIVVRDVLIEMFPKYADEIMAAKSPIQNDTHSAADMLKVIESWHLPSGKDAKDGRVAISINGTTLNVDDYKRDYFPFLFQRWQPRVLGFYGQGLAEELMPIQLEINKILRSIAIAQHLCSVPQIWMELQNQSVAKHVTNEFGAIHYYTGAPPIFMVPQAMSAEVYEHLERLYKRAFEITGISMMTATATKPSGMNAAVALREWSDIESDRFQLTSMRYQDFFIEGTYMAMDMMEELAEKGYLPKVRVADGDLSREISWKEVRIARDKLKMTAWPTDMLPSTPAGKRQSVTEMMQAGFFDREESLELLDFPDIRSVTSLKTASRSDIRRMLEKMVASGDYEPPEPYMGLQTARNLAQAYYLRGRTRGMPELGQELLRRFMDDCGAMISQAKLAQQPPGGLPAAQNAAAALSQGAPPMALPEGQPTSNLLPLAGAS